MPRVIRATTEFGPRLRKLRQERGWTLADLAERIDSSIRAVFYYEQEGRYPPAPVVLQLAQTFGVTVEWLMSGEESEHRSARVNDGPDLLNDAEDRRLWKRFRQLRDLSERDQAAIFRMIGNATEKRNSRRSA